jgi:uncharacterized membrane protein
VSSARTSGSAAGRGPLVAILAVIGVLAIIAAILYISGAANSLHFMIGSVHKGHHPVRTIVALVVGIAFLIGAYIARSRPSGAKTPSTSDTTSGSTTTTGS